MQLIIANKYHFDGVEFKIKFEKDFYFILTRKDNEKAMIPLNDCEIFFKLNGYVEVHIPEQIVMHYDEFFNITQNE